MPSIEEFKASLPDVQTAQQVFADIENQAFFAKLADHGVVPQTEAQAQSILRTAHLAEKMAQAHASQQPAAQDPYAALEQGVTKVAEQLGYKQASAQDDGLLDQIAISFASNPAVYGAALSLSQNAG